MEEWRMDIEKMKMKMAVVSKTIWMKKKIKDIDIEREEDVMKKMKLIPRTYHLAKNSVDHVEDLRKKTLQQQ